MKTQLIIPLLISLFIFSCNHNKAKNQRQNHISKIVFATGGCYGHCPFQVFSIDSNLSVKYHGVKYTDNEGFYIGKIEQKLFDTINTKFEKVNFRTLDTIYRGTVDGLNTELFIYYENKVKHISSPLSDLPDSVKILYHWLLKIQKEFDLKKIDHKIKFETRIEIPLEEIPPPFLEKMIEF